MTSLADTVLPLVRTRADLHMWSAANAHGSEMHGAIDVLDAARSTTDPAEFYAVVHAALASAVKVIARADDSSGIIGDACRRLLALHPQTAAAAAVAPSRLVDWMIKFQFDGDVDYFEIDLAIDWARQAADHHPDHQALQAADYWCELLARHRPAELVATRRLVFSRWPSATTAARLYRDAGSSWPDYRDEVLATLAARPDQAVLFVLGTLKDPRLAWDQANALSLHDDHVWAEVAKAYEAIDPLAVLPIHRRLVEHELVEAGAQHYRLAARRLAKMRKLAAGTDQADVVDAFIAGLRDAHRRRPRLQQEFDRARLP